VKHLKLTPGNFREHLSLGVFEKQSPIYQAIATPKNTPVVSLQVEPQVEPAQALPFDFAQGRLQ
jgi:hypothetical protein